MEGYNGNLTMWSSLNWHNLWSNGRLLWTRSSD